MKTFYRNVIKKTVNFLLQLLVYVRYCDCFICVSVFKSDDFRLNNMFIENIGNVWLQLVF